MSDLLAGTDPWATVPGQPSAVSHLRAAVPAPVHAYLFLGPAGVGKRHAASVFAGELLAAEAPTPDDAERIRGLAATESHPDVAVVERSGASINVEQAADIVRRASLSPVEGRRKVLILDEFHLVRPDAAARLLKTIEEPPTHTVFVVLAEEVTPELVTIASRCLTVPFRPLPDGVVADALVADGVDTERAREVAAASHGDLRRARLLVTDERLALRLAAWRDLPRRLDGTGATAGQLVDELRAMIDDAEAPLAAQQAREVDELNERIERYGQRGSGARELDERHKRERRRLRGDAPRLGLAELARVYRDHLAVANDPTELLGALEAIQELAEGLVRNPTETLQLLALLVRLPSVQSPPAR